MQVLYTMKFTALRLIRNFITLLLLLVVPLLLLTVFSIILAGVQREGIPVLDETSVMMVLAFQLFGGSVVMSYIHLDLFTEMRYRLQSLPISTTAYGFTVMLAGTIYSTLLGFILIVYTSLLFGVEWGSILWAVLIVALMALLSSIICLVFTFVVKNFKIAERLGEVYGVGAILLAGLFFPMPDIAVIQWVNAYINPLTIAYKAIDAYRRSDIAEASGMVGLLCILVVMAAIIMIVLGRRRMP